MLTPPLDKDNEVLRSFYSFSMLNETQKMRWGGDFWCISSGLYSTKVEPVSQNHIIWDNELSLN